MLLGSAQGLASCGTLVFLLALALGRVTSHANEVGAN